MTESLEELKDINLEQVIWDDLVKELKDFHTEQNVKIIIHPDVYKSLTEAQDDSFFGKLRYGFRLCFLSYQDWLDAMSCGDYVEEFFEYLGNMEKL